MSDRQKWATAICASGGPGRYLLPGTDLEIRKNTDDLDDHELQSFLERLDDLGASSELLATAYWFAQPTVSSLIFDDLPTLLRNLGHASRTAPPRISPSFKGRVFWENTILGRMSGTIPRAHYLVQDVERSANIPENQLLKIFLSRVRVAAQEMALKGTGALPTKIAALSDAASNALSNSYLSKVEGGRVISARMLATARRHRDQRYARLADLARDFDQAIRRGKWGQILALLQKGWLAPITSEDLFELYSLIRFMQALEHELGFGSPIKYGLIQRGRSAVVRYQHPSSSVEAELYFDQVPSGIFGTRSEYLDLIGQHDGIRGQERRPDIAIRFKKGDSETRLLVEVKETLDQSYTRDSIYKTLGYLRDFGDIWTGKDDQKPKAILVFPTAINPPQQPADLQMISADCLADISKTLTYALPN